MRFHIQTISNKLLWEEFNLNRDYPSIFQSFNFGEAQKKTGQTINRLGFYKADELCGIAQVTHVQAKRGHFLHIRGGPIFKEWVDFTNFFPLLKKYAKDNNLSFIRISPPILISDEKNIRVISKLRFRNVPIPLLDAEVAWVLDLNKDENQLLNGMRKTTRYLIKKAQKLGVEIKQSQNIRDADNLLRLYEIMTKEKGIVPHKGIIEEFREFVADNQVKIFSAYYKKKLLGAALIIFYGDEGIYHHSAHLRTKEDVPVSYLIQWEAIKEALKRGKKRYNFWGIEPTGNSKHPWAGLTLFKKGFGGNMRQFTRAKDYPLSLNYWITWLIETGRRIIKY